MKNKLFILPLILAFAPSLYAQDYAAYNSLLKKYAKADGVKYDKFAKSSGDKKILKGILADWAKIDATSLKKTDKAAFRINLYNAAMINAALDHYPIKSVTTIGEKFSIFKKEMIATPQGVVSLDTIEKKQLLKDFPDARIHFAVNCASVSCPPLRAEAYVGDQLEKQLSEQAALFSNSAHAYVKSGSSAKYSSLFNWYSKDFGTKNPAEYLNKYRSNKIDTNLKIDWQDYDWGLNQAK